MIIGCCNELSNYEASVGKNPSLVVRRLGNNLRETARRCGGPGQLDKLEKWSRGSGIRGAAPPLLCWFSLVGGKSVVTI